MESEHEVIDLTLEKDEKDHLTNLPAELLHMIFSYLYPTHNPDKAFHMYTDTILGEMPMIVRYGKVSHSLDFLAATCKLLRSEVMDWAVSELRQHKDITKYKPVKSGKALKRANFLRPAGGLLHWSEKNCVFCGKQSNRSAILMNGLRCCIACDEKEWPNKITKTAAMHEYDLKEHHILPHKHRGTMKKMLQKHPGGLPKLRYGTFMCNGVATTMFLRKDVEALATFAHGDLKAHLAKRQKEREERSRKLQATKNAKMAKEWERVQAIFQWFNETQPSSGGSRGTMSLIEANEDVEVPDDLFDAETDALLDDYFDEVLGGR